MTNKTNRHIFRLTTLLGLGVLIGLLGSCSSSEPLYQESDEVISCELVVSLNIDNSDSRDRISRADDTWENANPDYNDDGTMDEQKINDVDLYLISNKDNRYRIHRLTPWIKSTDATTKTYRIVVDLEKDFVELGTDGKRYLSGRIEAFANIPDPSVIINPFEQRLFDISTIREKKVIPMWGVTTLNEQDNKCELIFDEVLENWTTNAGSITLLRAMPKLTFQLAEEVDNDFVITDIDALEEGFEKTGYFQPTGYRDVNFTKDLSIEGCFNPVADEKKKIPTEAYLGLDTRTVSVYTPERKCPTESGNTAGFKVTIKRKTGDNSDSSYSDPITGTVYLCDYSEGQPIENTAFTGLVRNHDYQYIINLTPFGFKIDFHEWKFGGKVHVDLDEVIDQTPTE